MWKYKSKADKLRETQSELHKLYGKTVKYSKLTAMASPDMVLNEYERKIKELMTEITTILNPKFYIDVKDLEEIRNNVLDYQHEDGSRMVHIPTAKIALLDTRSILFGPQFVDTEMDLISNAVCVVFLQRKALLAEKKEFQELYKGWKQHERRA